VVQPLRRLGCSDMMLCMIRIWLLFIAAVAWPQEPSRVAPLQFEAASVKAVQPENLAPSRITTDPGRLKAQSVSIDALIAYAYGVQPVQIVDLKSGLGLYDVEGKADGAYTPAELRVMLQGLLAERFRLKFHREMREMPVERLVIGKRLMLQATESTEADPHGFTLRASERGPSFLKAKASAMSLEWLANHLSGRLSKLVVDETGLKGVFQFEVDFEFDRAEAVDVRIPEREVSNHIREGMLSALGLKLESGKKAQVEVLVIDQVERPEAN
jgi:uncharacterized protein (TIGR03435 family)